MECMPCRRHAGKVITIPTDLNLQILSPAAQERSLAELAVMEGFVPNRHGLQTIIIGVDARYVPCNFMFSFR